MNLKGLPVFDVIGFAEGIFGLSRLFGEVFRRISYWFWGDFASFVCLWRAQLIRIRRRNRLRIFIDAISIVVWWLLSLNLNRWFERFVRADADEIRWYWFMKHSVLGVKSEFWNNTLFPIGFRFYQIAEVSRRIEFSVSSRGKQISIFLEILFLCFGAV